MDEPDQGRELYEERLTFLPGLWMPAAPDWDELPEEDRKRWRRYAAELGAGPSQQQGPG